MIKGEVYSHALTTVYWPKNEYINPVLRSIPGFYNFNLYQNNRASVIKFN